MFFSSPSFDGESTQPPEPLAATLQIAFCWWSAVWGGSAHSNLLFQVMMLAKKEKMMALILKSICAQGSADIWETPQLS